MKIIEEKIELKLNYDLNKIDAPESIFFLNIETTGISPYDSALTTIGILFMQDQSFVLRQWFSESLQDELSVLKEFIRFTKRFKTLIHFNGNRFDLPYLKSICAQYHLDWNPDLFRNLNLYQRILPKKTWFSSEKCTQKALEESIGFQRKNTLSGKEIAKCYDSYIEEKNPFFINQILLHNKEDLISMVNLLPFLYYTELSKITAQELQVVSFELSDALQVTAKISFRFPIPKKCDCIGNISMQLHEDKIDFQIPIYEGNRLKIYYPDCKNYYYLIYEDYAVHKKIADFVEEASKKPATPETCYSYTEFKSDPDFLCSYLLLLLANL